MSIKIRVSLGLLVASVSFSSYAGEWSAGITAGQTSFDQINDVACFGGGFANTANVPGADFCTNDTDGNALGLNLGYSINDTFGFEVGYVNLDEYEADILIGGDALVGRVFAEPEALYAAIVGSVALSDRFSVNGRAGYYDLDTKLGVSLLDDSITGFEPGSDSGFYSGASLDYRFTDQFTAQIRYDDFGLDVVSLGLKYTFN